MDANQTQKELEEFIKKNTATLYKTTANDIGVGAETKITEKRHGINGLFTNVK